MEKNKLTMEQILGYDNEVENDMNFTGNLIMSSTTETR